MIKATGLWLHTSPSGEAYMTGNLGSVRVVIFKNKYNNKANKEPNYILYFDETKKQSDSNPLDENQKPELEDDVPF